MGNQVDKTHGGRGQALGSSKDPPSNTKQSKQSKQSKLSKFKKKKKQHVQHPIYHSQAEQRAARSKLISKKQVNVQSELNKKEKILHIMNAADAVSQGQKVPEAPKHMQYNNKTNETTQNSSLSPKSKSNINNNNKTNASSSSLYMADPSSKEALAAEARIKQKTLNKIKNKQERKDRTMDLLFGDGLKQKEEEYDTSKYNEDEFNINNKNKNNKDAVFSKSDKDVPLSSNSNTAKAALARFGQQKNNKIINQKDRKNRTMQLMHGNLLKNEDEVKAQPRQRVYNDDIDPDIAEVHQSMLNLNNCNPHDKMPSTAKLLRKVVTNLLSAETKEDQDKFGKLRLTNKKIKAAFVDMEYGVEILQALGFEKKKIYNDKEHKMDDYMVFEWININHKALIHTMDLLNEYYPEQQ